MKKILIISILVLFAVFPSVSALNSSINHTATYQRINLSSLKILTNKLCTDKDNQIRFKSLDKDGVFTQINWAKLYINNSEITSDFKYYKKSLNHSGIIVIGSPSSSKDYYWFGLGNLTGKTEIKVSVYQLGKEINETKIITPINCRGFKYYIKIRANKINNLIGDNLILSSIIIFLILLGIMVRNQMQQESLLIFILFVLLLFLFFYFFSNL